MKPKVKPSEKSRVLTTNDYAMFTMPDMKISTKHLEVVKESIKDKNLSRDYPILVDDEYNIVEGKYRFLACYDLRLPIFYKVAEVTSLADAIKIKHIHKNVPVEDVVTLYMDKPQYNNIRVLYDALDGIFSMHEIASKVGDKNSWGLDRKIFNSGQMSEWDYSKEYERFKVARYIYEKYGFDTFSCYSFASSVFWKTFVDDDDDDRIITIEDVDAQHQLLSMLKKIQEFEKDEDKGYDMRWNRRKAADTLRNLKDRLEELAFESGPNGKGIIYHSTAKLLSAAGVKHKIKKMYIYDNDLNRKIVDI